MNSTTTPLPDKATWEAGRDLAAEMYGEIIANIKADGGAGMYIEGVYRYLQIDDIKTLPYLDGVQTNVCEQFIRRLLDSPHLIPGFAAVLTGTLFEKEAGEIDAPLKYWGTVTYEQWIEVPEDEDGVRQTEQARGAQAVVDLMARIHEISNETCLRLGDGVDARDYKAMADDIASTFDLCLSGEQHARLGFIRAMTDFLAVNADGCGVESKGWEPLQRTEFAFSGALEAALQAGEPKTLSVPSNCAMAINDLSVLLSSLKGAQSLCAPGDAVWRVIDHALFEYDTVIEKLRAGNLDEAMYAAHEAESFVAAAAALESSGTNSDGARALTATAKALDRFSSDMDIGGKYHPATQQHEQKKPAASRKTSARKAVAA